MYKDINPADWRDAEVFAYVRKSLVLGEEDRISEVKQREAIAGECTRLQLPEPTWFADVKGHRSGRHEHTRPEWRIAKSRFLSSKKSVLVVYELDRTHRNVQAMAELINQIRVQPTRYRLVLVMDRFDSARDGWGASVINQLNMNSAMAQYESDKATERMTNTIRTMQEHLVPWGTTPYGLLRVGRGMKAKLVRGVHAEQVSTLLRLYVRGMGYKAVAEELNRRGMHYYKGSRDNSRNRMETPQRWNDSRVRQIVGNAMVYAGFMIPMRGRSFQRKVKLAGEGTLLERCARAYSAVRTDHIEPLIPDEIAEAVLARKLSVEERGRRRPSRGWTALIGGIAYFGDRPLRSHHDREIRTYRTRTGRPSVAFNADDVEQQLMDNLKLVSFPAGVIEKVRQIVTERTSDSERRQAEIVARKAEAALLDIERKSALGEINEHTYRTLKEEFTAQLAAAQKTLREWDGIERAMASLTNLGSVLRTAGDQARWQAVYAMFEKVEITAEGKIGKLVPRPWAKCGIFLLKWAFSGPVVTNYDPYGTRTRV